MGAVLVSAQKYYIDSKAVKNKIMGGLDSEILEILNLCIVRLRNVIRLIVSECLHESKVTGNALTLKNYKSPGTSSIFWLPLFILLMCELNTANCYIWEMRARALPWIIKRVDGKVRNSCKRLMNPDAGMNSVGVLLCSSQTLDLYNVMVSDFHVYFQSA